jgi:DNA-binding transcriptional MerR regulator
MADTTKGAKQTVNSADPLWEAVYKVAYEKDPTDPGRALRAAMSAITNHISAPAILNNIIGTGLSSVADVLAIAVQSFTNVKADSQNGIHDLMAALLGDALLLDIKGDDIPDRVGAEAQAEINSAIGAKYVGAIKQFVGAEGTVDGTSAEKGAAALVGLAMQMAINTSFYAAAGGCVPLVHLDELKELGEQLEKSLGLSRLIRRALTPLIQQTIALPLQRKYAAQYRQNILGIGELAKAVLADRMQGDRAKTLLQEHGLSDPQIAELLEQHTPRLKSDEFEHLAAFGGPAIDSSLDADFADGAPDVVRNGRTKLLTWKRLSADRNRILTAVLSNIKQGFAEVGDLDGWLSRFGVPEDEATLWRLAAGYEGESVRKRISQGEMLFLYEASQVTDEDVRLWLQSEGFSVDDVERMLTYFRFKAIEATHKTTGGAAARAAHLHNEHVAYVTDEITGLWGRKPTAAELDYWVKLLDTSERTKGDFKTELKSLDTTGPAIPPS